MTDHLHHHPDHHRAFPAGHDFTLVSTIDIARKHEALHLGFFHEHDRPWHVLEKEEDMKTLDLKVTVSGSDPDGTLATMIQRGDTWLKNGQYSLSLTKVERADGQEIGLEAAFEEYWRGNVGEKHGDDASDEKLYARQAFLYAAKKYGKGRPA
jgi:hypothetical protein